MTATCEWYRWGFLSVRISAYRHGAVWIGSIWIIEELLFFSIFFSRTKSIVRYQGAVTAMIIISCLFSDSDVIGLNQWGSAREGELLSVTEHVLKLSYENNSYRCFLILRTECQKTWSSDTITICPYLMHNVSILYWSEDLTVHSMDWWWWLRCGGSNAWRCNFWVNVVLAYLLFPIYYHRKILVINCVDSVK